MCFHFYVLINTTELYNILFMQVIKMDWLYIEYVCDFFFFFLAYE